MPDATTKRMKRWTLRKGQRWRIGGVEVVPPETIALDVDATVKVERVKPDCQCEHSSA